MKYAEVKNEADAYMINDTYINYRLTWVQNANALYGDPSGIHIDVSETGERVCTLPYLDYANHKSFLWPESESQPIVPVDILGGNEPPYPFFRFYPHYYVGSPFIFPIVGEHYGGACVRPTIWLEYGPRHLLKEKNTGIVAHPMYAIASAMPNIVYTFTQYTAQGVSSTQWPIRYFVNLWQRSASVTLPVYKDSVFSGWDVGYTDMEQVEPYPAWPGTGLKSTFKVVDNEKFKYWTFEQEARLSTMVFAYGLENSSEISDRGEMIVKNATGKTIFNNRYDYMRILRYIPSINALAIDGKNLYNAPKRFSFPGRKIAVVALHPYCCMTGSPPGADRGVVFNTGFWFPDPSTVEFTTCATLCGSIFTDEAYQTPAPSIIKMAELLNVMILDVTGCTPGWRYEAETGQPWARFLDESTG